MSLNEDQHLRALRRVYGWPKDGGVTELCCGEGQGRAAVGLGSQPLISKEGGSQTAAAAAATDNRVWVLHSDWGVVGIHFGDDTRHEGRGREGEGPRPSCFLPGFATHFSN